MKGEVYRVDEYYMLFAVKTEIGISILEMMKLNDLEVGDVIEWDGDSPLGFGNVVNHTRGYTAMVYFEEHDAPDDENYLKRRLSK